MDVDSRSKKLVSLVVPIFNEQDAVPLFLNEVSMLLKRSDTEFEVIFVDDGSSDTSVVEIQKYSIDCDVSIVRLTRNFGKEAALTAGLNHINGDAAVPIDVDLQDPLELVETFIRHWKSGYDVVYGVRVDRSSDSGLKRFTASVFYRLFNYLSSESIPENVGDFRLMDKRVVEAVLSLKERNRFMKGLFSWVGYRSIGVPYKRLQRAAGKTKWNYWRLWNFAIDGVASFSLLPLKIWTYVGVVIALISFSYGAAIIIRTMLLGIVVDGWASLMVAVVFFGGVQLITLGVLGEYLGRVFVESKGRPIYLVESVSQQTQKINITNHSDQSSGEVLHG